MIAWKSCYLSKNMSLREHLERVHVKAHVKGMAQQIPKETDANHPTIRAQSDQDPRCRPLRDTGLRPCFSPAQAHDPLGGGQVKRRPLLLISVTSTRPRRQRRDARPPSADRRDVAAWTDASVRTGTVVEVRRWDRPCDLIESLGLTQ